jgi:hypothetical protein
MALTPTSTLTFKQIIIGATTGPSTGFGASDGTLLYTVPLGKTCTGQLVGIPLNSLDSGRVTVKITSAGVTTTIVLATKVSSQVAVTTGPMQITLQGGSSLVATGNNTGSSGADSGVGASFIGSES